MDPAIRNKLRETVLRGRFLLENTVREEFQGRYGIYAANNKGRESKGIVVEPEARMGHLEREERETRKVLVDHLSLIQAGGATTQEALDTFVREAAFTWLNRFVAFKMFEARGLIRETVTRLENSNGFKMWLAEPGNEEHLADYEKGDLPQNGRGEGPRQRAYRAFLLAQCRKLSEEVRVLFDPDALVSRFLPAPRVLRDLMELLNDPLLTPAWQPGNEETIGWVYQGFNSEELEAAFRQVRTNNKRFEAKDIPAVTQLFTPRWIVRFLVENTLGRLWLEMHPDSQLAFSLDYLVPLRPAERTLPTLKSVRDITLLDPACGTMHFGLVAFDLFAEMYREEMRNAGKPGWPMQPPLQSEDEIPAAIIAHNIHGIDIDLRAVQLSALTLYLKAKTTNPKARLSETRLACANVHMLDGDNLKRFVEQMKLGPIYRRILTALQARLTDSEQLGSLLRLEGEIRELVAEERKRYEREGKTPDLFGWHQEIFETEAGQREFWETLEVQIGQALDAFAREHSTGVQQTFFAGETAKGLRLLELMARRYDVVVTNPPYMSSRKMNSRLKSLVAASYPAGKGDLYAAFTQRCIDLANPTGRVGMLTMHSFMFISSYEKLRSITREQAFTEAMAHAGPALFDVGNPGTLQTSAYVLRREADPEARQNAVGTYFRLVKEPDSEAKRQRFERAVANLRAGKDDPIVFRYRQGDFDAIPGSPWVYWCPLTVASSFQRFPILQGWGASDGHKTADNFRFIRYHWELDRRRQTGGRRWRPSARALEQRPYAHAFAEYVDWSDAALEVYKANPSASLINEELLSLSGVSWSRVSAHSVSARRFHAGTIPDVSTPAIFINDDAISATVAAVMNSRLGLYILKLLNPTINLAVGNVRAIPVPTEYATQLHSYFCCCEKLCTASLVETEVYPVFIAPPEWPDGIQKAGERHARLAEIERQIDEEVYRLYGIAEQDRRAIEAELAEGGLPSEDAAKEDRETADAEEVDASESFWSKESLAKAWISYGVGIVMGQFQPGAENGLGRGRFNETTAARLRQLKDVDGLLVVDSAHPDDIAAKVFTALEIMLGEQGSEEVVREALGSNGSPLERLRDYLADKFFKEHTQKYRKRPIYWYLRSAKGNYGLWLYYHRLDKDILFKALLNYVEPKIRLEEDRLKTLRARKEAAGTSGREAKQIEREMDRQEQFVAELHDFKDKLRRAADLHITPDLNDGVVLNIAPLWELVPWKEPKKYWEELQEGKYDWAHIALELWPDRVKEKCRTDRSIAIAHGLEHLCEVSPPKARRAAANAEAPNEDQEESEEEEYADDGAV